ncbi:MAG: DUF1080 domain-containing protein, partial [Bacteroidota bacterium]
MLLITFFACHTSPDPTPDEAVTWENLLDAELSQWDIFLGVPHKASGIPGYEAVENVKEGTPLGLHRNDKDIFTVTRQDGEAVLRVSGEIFGSLNSRKAYENYHLRFQFRWGEKKWPPRLEATRNSGLLYHSIGAPGSGLWNTWMSSLELEVEETNCGDFITINDKQVRAKCPAVQKADGKFYFDPTAPLQVFWWDGPNSGRCYKNQDVELPHGEWNTMELITFGDEAFHVLNGQLLMSVHEPAFFDG